MSFNTPRNRPKSTKNDRPPRDASPGSGAGTGSGSGPGSGSGSGPDTPLAPWRIKAFAAGAAVLLAIAVGYGFYAAHRHSAADAATPAPEATFSLTGAPKIVYLSTSFGSAYEHVSEVRSANISAEISANGSVGIPTAPTASTAPTGAPTVTTTGCERSYAAADTLLCLRTEGSIVATQYAEVYHDTAGVPKLVDKVELPGIPSRARLSADGEMAAWTVFVSGDSYNGPNFSTRTGILDLRTRALVPNLEAFTAYVDGAPYHAVDVNYWGVTFTSDDDHFYATMGSAGQTWLMYGDLAAQTLHSVTTNVECPSLSPDGTRIVFKKRVSADAAAPWRLYVIDLATLQETPLAETRSIDDQAAWLGNDTVMYDVPQTSGTGYDIWAVPADGTGKPKLIVHDGFSPAAIDQG